MQGLEKQLHNFKSQVNSVSNLDMCFKLSKFHETSRLSNKTVYFMPTIDGLKGDQNIAALNHALIRGKY